MPLSWSMDPLGPLTRTVMDAALLLGAIAGFDALDATSGRRGVPYYERVLDTPVEGLRVGLAENYYFEGLDAEMAAGVRAAAGVLADLGAEVAPVRVPDPAPLVEGGHAATPPPSPAIPPKPARARPPELAPPGARRPP